MTICVPVTHNLGLKSPVYNHFGSAPWFLLVDPETMQIEALSNRNQAHHHGQCNPLKALSDHQVDAVVVGGIGLRALERLQSAGIDVFESQGRTVQEALDHFKAGRLFPIDPERSCTGHH